MRGSLYICISCSVLMLSCSPDRSTETLVGQSKDAADYNIENISPASSEQNDEQVPKEMLLIVPDGWLFHSIFENTARFNVSIHGEGVDKPVLAKGYIAMDDTLESHLQVIRFSRAAEASAKEEYSEEAKSFPDITGYSKFADSRRFGFDTRLQMPLLSARYVNRELGIFCRMNRPGKATCVWGRDGERMLLAFDSLETEIVLPYVLNIAKQGR